MCYPNHTCFYQHWSHTDEWGPTCQDQLLTDKTGPAVVNPQALVILIAQAKGVRIPAEKV